MIDGRATTDPGVQSPTTPNWICWAAVTGVGAAVGEEDGLELGVAVGEKDGLKEGGVVGERVGRGVGDMVANFSIATSE